jgi:hypothetical protein
MVDSGPPGQGEQDGYLRMEKTGFIKGLRTFEVEKWGFYGL